VTAARDFAEMTYYSKHRRVRRIRGKADRCIIYLCHTGSTTYQWANISHQHRDIMDYMPMCVSHHEQYDMTDERRAKNARPGNQYSLGNKHSDATKAKMSASHLGNPGVPGNQNARGHVVSDKAKAVMSETAPRRGLKGACQRHNISRGLQCSCGQHAGYSA
jgi:hypothetical protein